MEDVILLYIFIMLLIAIFLACGAFFYVGNFLILRRKQKFYNYKL